MAIWIIFFLLCVLSTDTRIIHDAKNQTIESAKNISTVDRQELYYLEFSVSPEEMETQMMIG